MESQAHKHTNTQYYRKTSTFMQMQQFDDLNGKFDDVKKLCYTNATKLIAI